MPDFISSGWFISIAGGLLVTLIWEIIRFFMDRKAYNRQIKLVRNDFSKIIKTIISEEAIPSMKVLESLLKGLAQKHNVKYKDVFEVSYIFYALVGDVMESNFLDYNQKIEFCEKLEVLSAELTEQLQPTNDLSVVEDRNNHSKYKLLQFTSVLAISSLFISIMLFFIGSNETIKEIDRRSLEFFYDNPNMILFLVLILIIIMATLFRSMKIRIVKEKE